MIKSLKNRRGLTAGREMTESVMHQRVLSIQRCFSVHHAMAAFTCCGTRPSERNEGIGKRRCQRDFKDLTRFIKWFDQHTILSVYRINFFFLPE